MKNRSGWKTWVSLIVCGIIVISYFAYYPKCFRKLQLAAYASKDLSVNSHIDTKGYYTKLILVTDPGYRYVSPIGRYPVENLKMHTRLSPSTTSFYKQPFNKSLAYLPLELDVRLTDQVRLGDEIALSVNGRIFPGRLSPSGFTVTAISNSATEKTLLVLALQPEHFSDSLWVKKSEDHILPIVLKRLPVPKCPGSKKPAYQFAPETGEGKYVCP